MSILLKNCIETEGYPYGEARYPNKISFDYFTSSVSESSIQKEINEHIKICETYFKQKELFQINYNHYKDALNALIDKESVFKYFIKYLKSSYNIKDNREKLLENLKRNIPFNMLYADYGGEIPGGFYIKLNCSDFRILKKDIVSFLEDVYWVTFDRNLDHKVIGGEAYKFKITRIYFHIPTQKIMSW